MAKLNMAIKHGQTPEEAQANFVKVITEAHERHGHWIKRVEWSADRTSATLTGHAYEVRLWYDEHQVYAQGHVPLAFKLLEGSIRRFVEQCLTKDS